ncbi:MAG: hypothetical protein E5V91_19820 [Mesorhizobium sp.]|nr:MAG: hypothetical protein E5V91_19820 [Mesorhizobium sp.]
MEGALETGRFFVTHPFILWQPNIFELLENGGPGTDGAVLSADEWFERCIALAAHDIAQQFGCSVSLSKLRTAEARMFWSRDLKRIDFAGRGNRPDAYKRAGFLAYWLRRRIVVNETTPSPGVAYDAPGGTARRANFVAYASDIVAFMIGFQLSCYYSLGNHLKDANVSSRIQSSVEYTYLMDVSRLMRMNNVSPHALYLIYRSIFLSNEYDTDLGSYSL